MFIRKELPTAANKYYLSDPVGWNPCILGNPDNRPYPNSVLANCIGSVVGRFNELAQAEGCPWLGNWYPGPMLDAARSQGLTVSDQITPGGVIVMLKANGVEGHVISVEKIEGYSIYTFESGWNYRKGTFFTSRWIDAENNFGMSSDYRFAGCICHPDIDPYLIPPDDFDTFYTQTGEYVKFIQWVLDREGCYEAGADNAIDGSCGPATVQAIKNYQAFHRLREDGYAGPSTLAVMKANYAIL